MFSDIQKMYVFSFFNNAILFGAVSVPFFIEWGKLNYATMFFLESWFMAWIFVLEVPSGVFADKYGRKTAVAMSSLLIAIGAVVFVLSPNFYVFVLAEFIWAAGVALSTGAQTALVYDTLKEDRKTKTAKYVFSRCQMAATLGVITSLPIGSVIAGAMVFPYPDNLTMPFALTAIPMMVSFLIVLALREPKRIKPIDNPFVAAVKGIKYLAFHKTLRALALDYTLISSVTFMVFWIYQPLLKAADVDITLWGVVASAFNVFGLVLLIGMKKMEKLFGIKKLLFISAFVPGAMYVVMGFYQPLWLVIVGIFLITGMYHLRVPMFEHYMNFHIRSRNRATVISAVSMMGRVVLVALYPLTGLLLDWSLNYALIVLGVLTIAFALTSKIEEKMLKG